MIHIQHVVVDKGMIDIADWDDHIASVLHLRPVIIQHTLDLGQQDTCQFLFDNMISRFLKVRIYGKIDVIAGLGFLLVDGLDHLPHAVDIQLDLTLLPLKIRIHRLLKTGFADDIRLGPFFLFFLTESVILFLGNLPDIADDVGKAITVRIAAHGFLFDIDSLKIIQILHNIGNRLLAHILGNSSRNIFLITVQCDSIADIHKLQYVCFLHLLLVDAVAVDLIGAQMLDQPFRGYVLLLLG